MRWEAAIDELRHDSRSGAEELAGRALGLLSDVVGDSAPEEAADYREWLVRLSRDVMGAQPSMAVFYRLVNDMLWACHEATEGEQIRQDALNFLQAYGARSQVTMQSLVENSCAYLHSSPVIMTYSRSSTVVRVLTAMGERGFDLRVLCSEGRPLLEGQTLASELGWAGVNVTMGVDMALFGWLSEAKALVLGADALSSEGLVNKIGTSELVRAALARDIPRIVLCTSSKFLPNDYVIAPRLQAGAPEEIMPVSSANITVENVYFGVTPLALVSTVVTEKGVLSREELLDELGEVHTYPGLRGR